MVTDRGLEVLRAIVRDYVSSREPVGSKSIVDRYGFGVSAATIRNDMASLEDEQLITAPHTSSGRIPTDKGYRVFVDHLADARALSSAQRIAIERFMDESGDFDDLLARTVRALAQLTNQVAVIQYPTLGNATVQHVELVLVTSRRLMVIVITDNGRVEQRLIESAVDIGADDVALLRTSINERVSGKPLADVATALSAARDDARLAAVHASISDAVRDLVQVNRQSRLVMTGTANLVKTESDFSGSVYPVLDAIEEQVVLLKLLTEMRGDSETVNVSIGHEHSQSVFDQTSVVSSGYLTGGELAQVGLIGPTRMDYSGNIAAVRAVARYLTHLLNSSHGH